MPASATGTGVIREETTAAVVSVAVSRVQTCLLARKPGFGTFELWAFGAVPEALIELLLLLLPLFVATASSRAPFVSFKVLDNNCMRCRSARFSSNLLDSILIKCLSYILPLSREKSVQISLVSVASRPNFKLRQVK